MIDHRAPLAEIPLTRHGFPSPHESECIFSPQQFPIACQDFSFRRYCAFNTPPREHLELLYREEFLVCLVRS